MPIDREEVRRIARLANLEFPRVQDKGGAWIEPSDHLLDDKMLDDLAEDLSKILEHVKALDALDVRGVPKTSHAVALQTLFREDEPTEPRDPNPLLDAAPARVGDGVSVPKILE